MSEEGVRAQLITATTHSVFNNHPGDALDMGVPVRLVMGAVIPGLTREQTLMVVGRVITWPAHMEHMRAAHLYWIRFPGWEGAYGRHQLSLDVVGLIATLDSEGA